jgi:hypothetical protein
MPAMMAGAIAARLAYGLAGNIQHSSTTTPTSTAPKTSAPPALAAIVTSGIVLALGVRTFLPGPPLKKQSEGLPKWGSESSSPFEADPLENAMPIEWRSKSVRNLGTIDPTSAVLSPDSKLLAGRDSADPHTIVVYDLHHDYPRRSVQTSFIPGRLGFNPRGNRVFAISGNDSSKCGIADLTKLVFSPVVLSGGPSVPPGDVAWWRENEVMIVSTTSDVASIHLETLQLTKADPASFNVDGLRRIVESTPLRNYGGKFGEGQMIESVELVHNKGYEFVEPAVKRCALRFGPRDQPIAYFPEIDVHAGDRLLNAASHSILLRFRSGRVEGFYFATRPKSAVSWKLNMPHGPEGLPLAKPAISALASGALFMILYAPSMQVDSGKPLGPNRKQPKARIQVLDWQGQTAVVWAADAYYPYGAGDVFCDLHISGSNQLIPFAQANEWWTLAEDPHSELTTYGVSQRLEKFRRADDKSLSEPNPRSPQPVVRTKPSAVAPLQSSEGTSPLHEEIATFVVEHHRKAWIGEVAGLVDDYADRVDYFTHGVVDRSFILKDETEYHNKYRHVQEQVTGPVRVTELGNTRVEVQYTMTNQWEKVSDGKKGGGPFAITLEIRKRPGGWEIVKHRAVKKH